jgi:UDP-N-acetylglucosamine--N-acetylmuramyl-(pentapeptide) pyrophosphoryl-undecaprenol N-acetylglucosamine transferase
MESVVEASHATAGKAGSRNVEAVPGASGHQSKPSICFRVLMAAGGTGGHIVPALVVAQELRARALARPGEVDWSIVFLGAGRELESRLVVGAGFPLCTVASAGLKGMGGWRKLRNLLRLPRSAFQAGQMLREFRPNVVVGTGGYAAGPVMLEAALHDIPTLLIEPNVVPGFTNRMLAPVVRRAAVAFEETVEIYGAKARATGAPIRSAFFRVPPKQHLPPFTVLILGGSQGSKAINECMVGGLELRFARCGDLRIIHQTGERDYHVLKEAYREKGVKVDLFAFIDNVPEALSRADIVISRAGAMTVAELAAAGKPSLLIPFPAATDSHQLQNARALERAGAACVIEQNELSPERLVKELCGLIDRPDRLGKMEQKARSLARPHAAERIADLIESLAATT